MASYTKHLEYMSCGDEEYLQQNSIRIKKSELSKLDTTSYTFSKFAASFFEANVTDHFINKPLKNSLLEHDLPAETCAAQAIWIMILRFMGDMPEPCNNNDQTNNSYLESPSVMRGSVGHSLGTQLMLKTLQGKSKLLEKLRFVLEYNGESDYCQQILNNHCSNLDKLHFIIGHGILRSTLRDEIFAQICKQLTNNPVRSSNTKGWILLSLCLGCFTPSQYFEPYLRCFLRNGPQLYASFCENRLERTLKNGSRTQPPAMLELQAIRQKTPIKLEFILPDDSIKRIQIDAATNSRECVDLLSNHIGLVDKFGFSIIVQFYGKFMSLGAGYENLLDAISNCEQYAKEQNENEYQTQWKLYFRKEIFAPWYDPADDPLATNFIYKQVVRGLYTGEYRCRSEKDIAMLCALEYYVENGAILNKNLLRKCIPNYLPKDLLATGDKALNTWTSLIETAFSTNDYVRQNSPKEYAKEDICFFAHITWPMLLSRYFEALHVAGPKLPKDEIVIAINSNGIFLIDETEQIFAEVSYAEITTISVDKSNDPSNEDVLHINTIQNENFSFKCFESQDAADLLNFMLENLKNRSKYAIVVRDYSLLGNNDVESSDRLHLVTRGDFVELTKGATGANISASNNLFVTGICNNKSGLMPIEILNILPTLKKPTLRVMKYYQENLRKPAALEKINLNSSYNTFQRQRMHTLQKFAEIYFRNGTITDKHRLRQLHTPKPQTEELWRHSFDLIKAPLLKSLQNDKVNFKKAIDMYQNVLKYMGDMPNSKTSSNTDLIFEPALKNALLCDELYCQLMKQLTDNHIQQSEEQGWDLIYLATGIMYPSQLIRKELLKFLRTRTHFLALESLRRIKSTIKKGQRKRAPHVIEVEAIQNRFMHIYHKIYFPDNTVENFEIKSCMRASNLAAAIASRLRLNSTEGFSIFVQIGDKAFSMPTEEFVFDYINELMHSVGKLAETRTQATTFPLQYQLHFMRKLWLNVELGQDPNADSIFHYSQELPKYLNGYYCINMDLAIKLAAFLYVIEYDGEFAPLQRIQEVLPYIVPDDMIPVMKSQEWKRTIINGVKELMDRKNIDETFLKFLFLKEIFKQQMFGSTFFPVKQTNNKDIPETILIAINSFGFHILNPKTKNTIHSYNYNELSLWSSGNTYFHIRFGNMIVASKLLCSTSQGFKMDDLLSSYMSYFNKKL